ncbi:YggS family pyridoxal phosphate-dependent enzyme [Ottowia caeni]|uniref:YggS family pyridoxal phosphate-dependent enzyme n=1 Tax=Ottowia caeni TaxID=2870339 RepID=UPI001E50E7C3|nr:YggS family pyridoxal phosphate-dependent enzyme [Ottowia caeni]
MTTIADKLQQVHERIAQASARAGRNVADIALLAVSKTCSPDAVRQAHAAGQCAFGENYVQEGVEKIAALRDLALQWHCIGPIQSNKTRLVAENFDWVHTIDRLKIAERLSAQRPPDKAPLNVCIQVNVDGGTAKSGVAPADALALAREVAQLPRVRLRGVMSIPEPASDFESALSVHQKVRGVFDEIRHAGLPLDTLSIGMSADLEAAIAAGSTMVRVGTAIFGARNKT